MYILCKIRLNNDVLIFERCDKVVTNLFDGINSFPECADILVDVNIGGC